MGELPLGYLALCACREKSEKEARTVCDLDRSSPTYENYVWSEKESRTAMLQPEWVVG